MSETSPRFSWFGFLLGPLVFFHHRYMMAGLASVLVQAVLIFAYVMMSGAFADLFSISLLIYNIAHGFWEKWFPLLPQELREVSPRPSTTCMAVGIVLSLLAVTPLVKPMWDKYTAILEAISIPEEL